MKYLLEIYRNKEIIDRKYAYTKEELIEWFKSNYNLADIIYYFWELRGTGNYFNG